MNVPAEMWEGEEAILNCTPDISKADIPAWLWYKNKQDDAYTVCLYARVLAAATKAYNSFVGRTVGRWVGSVQQLSISYI